MNDQCYVYQQHNRFEYSCSFVHIVLTYAGYAVVSVVLAYLVLVALRPCNCILPSFLQGLCTSLRLRNLQKKPPTKNKKNATSNGISNVKLISSPYFFGFFSGGIADIGGVGCCPWFANRQ